MWFYGPPTLPREVTGIAVQKRTALRSIEQNLAKAVCPAKRRKASEQNSQEDVIVVRPII
jgi:hypothetical protein